MEGTHILPNLLAFNNNRVPNTLIVRDSPNNNSLLNAITEMNTRLHNKRMEKVKENRMKIRSTVLKSINLENYKAGQQTIKKTVNNDSLIEGILKKFDEFSICESNNDYSSSMKKNKTLKIGIEASKPNVQPDIISSRKISLFKEPKKEEEFKAILEDEFSYPSIKTSLFKHSNNRNLVDSVEDKNEYFTNHSINKPSYSKQLQPKEEALYVQFYRAVNSKKFSNITESPNKIFRKRLRKELLFENSNNISRRGRDKNNLPNVYPTVLYKDNTFDNQSQKRRYETIHQKLSDLRYIIEKNKGENEYEMIRNFLEKNKIYDNSLYQVESLYKISQFLRTDFIIDPKLSLLETLQSLLIIKNLKKSKLGKKPLIKDNLEIKQNKINSFNMKDYNHKLENLFNNRFIPNKSSPVDIINRLEGELSEATEKAKQKKIKRAKSKKLKIDEEKDVDSLFEYDDIDDIKKNRKLLELIVVIIEIN